MEPYTFLQLLSEEDRASLMELGGIRRFARGEHLMHEGEPGDRVLIVLRGHVKTSVVDSQGHEIVLSFRGPGDVLGELSLAGAEPRSSSAIAIEPVEARGLAASEFLAFLEQRPSAALTLINVLGRRFRDSNRKHLQFAALDTLGRVAARLIELCERYGDPVERGVEIRLPITQEDLGSWTASSRAGVASALKTMRELGWIRTERRRITVLDIDAVSQRSA
jgi:CRP/FNR family transcriptional regulator, cyclic AMP receptor protein